MPLSSATTTSLWWLLAFLAFSPPSVDCITCFEGQSHATGENSFPALSATACPSHVYNCILTTDSSFVRTHSCGPGGREEDKCFHVGGDELTQGGEKCICSNDKCNGATAGKTGSAVVVLALASALALAAASFILTSTPRI